MTLVNQLTRHVIPNGFSREEPAVRLRYIAAGETRRHVHKKLVR